MSRERIDELLRIFSGTNRALILTHNDPDPDAISSAVALGHLLRSQKTIEVKIAYRGIIGRAENKALVRYLGNPLQPFSRGDLDTGAAVALVDTQPGAGNGPLRNSADIAVIFDHHPWRQESSSARFVEVRSDVGATSTILTEYLLAAGIEIPSHIATALFYGLKTDTMGLGRSRFAADAEAYSFLVRQIDSRALFEIERAQVPAAYFKSLVNALQAVQIYRDVLIAYIGRMEYPDLAAEIADWLLRLKGVQWVICLGAYQGSLIVAVRSRNLGGGAGRLTQAVISDLGTSGGHGTMAGGQVRLDGRNPEDLAILLTKKVLTYFNISEEETRRSLL